LEIHTLDGAFDYFDGFCHACSPFPSVYLGLEGTKMIDISHDYLAAYDDAILKIRHKLKFEDLQRLRVLDENVLKAGEEATATQVLEIVLAYLYSGRREQAHRALTQMWPAFDVRRMWDLILKTRREGVLKEVSGNTSNGRIRKHAHGKAPPGAT
jgi:hypothetical protein